MSSRSVPVGIYGAGAIALSTAALVASRGHRATLFSPSRRIVPGQNMIRSSGSIAGTFQADFAESAEGLCARNNVILIAAPAMAHKQACDALAPCLSDRHCVLVSAHLSFTADYLKQLLDRRAIHTRICAWSTTPVTARTMAPLEVRVNAIRRKLGFVALNQCQSDILLGLSGTLTGIPHTSLSNSLCSILENTNPILHLAMILGNFSQAERGETWCQRQNLTPRFARYIEQMDHERLQIAAQYDLAIPPISEQFGADPATPDGLYSAFQARAAERSVKGPPSLSTRYIDEDIPFGAYVLEWLGAQCGIETPALSAGISILSNLMDRDLRAENDILPELDSSQIG